MNDDFTVTSKSRGFSIIVSEIAQDGSPSGGWERTGKFYWRSIGGIREATYRNSRTLMPLKALDVSPNDWRTL